MTYHVEVGPEVKNNTHHVSLTDGEKTVGLIICDSKGAADPFNISMNPNQRSALRTKSGSTKYEDLEEPWSATAQDDWSGGRAQEDWETDTTKFYDSKRCQTAFNQIYCAPLDHYASGLKESISNYPGSVSWKTVNGSFAYRIDLTEPMTAGEIYILLRRRGSPKTGLSVGLSQNTPEETIQSHTYTTAEITDVLCEWKKFSFDNISLAAGTYYITVTAESDDRNGYWQIGFKQNMEDMSTYVLRNENWELYPNWDMYYRLAAGDSGRLSRFFTYKQLTFAVTQLSTGSPKLYVNGDIGMCANTAAGSKVIRDTSKNWEVNEWAGCRVGIIQGTGIAETVSVWRTIVSNTANTLTVDEPWLLPHDSSSSCYIIYDTDRFTEIPAETHGLTSYVTDITIANDIIYFAQGDETPIRKMKWRNGSWSSMADECQMVIRTGSAAAEEATIEPTTVPNCAMYLQTVRDTTGLVLWRAQNNDSCHQISISQTAVTDWREEEVVLADLQPTDAEVETERIPAISADNDDFYTDGVDFGKPDDVSTMYKIVCGIITGDDLPTFDLTLQFSEDNNIWEDGRTLHVQASQGIYYMACKSTKRYRRFHIKISAGTGSAMESLLIETCANSKFVGAHTFNDSYGKITGLAEYPMMMNSQYKTLWIMREGMIHSISSETTVDVINLPELETVMEEWNGKSSLVHNVYFYFRWMRGSIQRYYNQQVDSVGPDRDMGLPEERQGQISDMMGYPGRYFVSVDAGENGYSSVLLNNNSGWHEIYRAPNAGERITAMGYQAISGDRPDRLWISVGDDVVWLVMPSNTLKAYYDPQAEYIYESVLESSWYSIGMVDVVKQWGSMNVMAENLKRNNIYIEADYQIDRDPTWYPMSADYTDSPTQEIKFKDKFGISAKRLRYRLRLQTNDKSKTPFIKAVVLKTVIRVDTKYNFGMSCRNLINDVNLCGEPEDITPWQRLETLIGWANNATALKMRGFTYPFDNRIVFLDPPSVSNLREKKIPGMILTVSLNEI